jgi:hypothetical protein
MRRLPKVGDNITFLTSVDRLRLISMYGTVTGIVANSHLEVDGDDGKAYKVLFQNCTGKYSRKRRTRVLGAL